VFCSCQPSTSTKFTSIVSLVVIVCASFPKKLFVYKVYIKHVKQGHRGWSASTFYCHSIGFSIQTASYTFYLYTTFKPVCIIRNLFYSCDRGDAIKGHVTVNGDKICKAVEYHVICIIVYMYHISLNAVSQGCLSIVEIKGPVLFRSPGL